MRAPGSRAFIRGLIQCTLLAVFAGSAAVAQTTALPSRLSDAQFWSFIQDVSEPGGTFSSNNFVSNETMFQYAIPALQRSTKPGHVYLGVGPEQNFTYIAALKPGMAIIFDIRRGNLHLQMMYKALFELSGSRAQFLSRLFSRPLPSRLATELSIDSLFTAIAAVAVDSALNRKTFQEISDLLLKKHRFALSANDVTGIRFVFDAFFRAGPGLRYGGGIPRVPSYSDLMTQTDGQLQRSYLASEANWLFVKDMQMRNLIVPVVGDFAGDKAIRAVGVWLKERSATVQAFYVSNVEQYLYRAGNSGMFYENVATLPLSGSSMFIRANGSGGIGTALDNRPNLSCSMQDFLAAYRGGRATNYEQVVAACQ